MMNNTVPQARAAIAAALEESMKELCARIEAELAKANEQITDLIAIAGQQMQRAVIARALVGRPALSRFATVADYMAAMEKYNAAAALPAGPSEQQHADVVLALIGLGDLNWSSKRDADNEAFSSDAHERAHLVSLIREVAPAAPPAAPELQDAARKTMEEAAYKLGVYAGIYTGDKQARRLAVELSDLAAAPTQTGRAA